MRWALGIALGLLIAGSSALGWEPVGVPSLTVKGDGAAKVSLELTDLEVAVEVQGRVVETVMEMTFFNHTQRRQEGEFSLALPEGATVSTYALEVNGSMRVGVSVEKDQARHAYETIKRRNIDPGLVERLAGNVYQTRIFPILAGQPKRVRIGFIQTLGDDGRYELPLDAKDGVDWFSATVSGVDKASVTGVAGVQRSQLGNGAIRWSRESATLAGALTFVVSEEEEPLLVAHRQPDGVTHFRVEGPSTAVADREAASLKWRNLRIVWDTSRSGRERDHAKELAALNRLWKWLGQAEVEFVAQGYGEPVRQAFSVRDGAAPELHTFIKGLSYDGSADFSRIPTDHKGVTLLVTDGFLGTPIWGMPEAKGPRYIMTDGRSPDVGLMGEGGTWLDLSDNARWWKAVRQPRAAVEVTGIAGAEWDFSETGSRFLLTGRLPRDFAGRCEISIDGKTVAAFDPKEATPVGEWNLARRVWAQRTLARLERGGGTVAEISEFAIDERLVSDHTSLIVLERFEDHITFRIPPPEPDLLAQYERRVDGRAEQGWRRLEREWNRKIGWSNRPVSWVDPALSREIRTVGIWIKASRLAFPESKRNEAALEPLEAWLEESSEFAEEMKSLDTRDKYVAWRQRQTRRLEQLAEIREQAPKVDAEGDLHVSIRGRLPERGIYSATGDATLWSIFDELETDRQFLDLSRVYLYRNGQRTGYNMWSDAFEPPALHWGDMIVVGPTDLSGSWSGRVAPSDPFSDPFMSAPRDTGAVFEPTGNGGSSGPVDPFGAPASSPDPKRAVKATFVAATGPDGAGERDDAILEDLRGSDMLEARYVQRLVEEFGGVELSLETVVEIARLFFERQQPERGEAVLSNLLEFDQNSIENVRAFAFWLAEFGRENRAIELLADLATRYEGEATEVLLTHDIGQLTQTTDGLRRLIVQEAELPQSTGLGAIALTDFFGRGGEWREDAARLSNSMLPSDLRIVVSSAGGEVDFELRPMDDFEESPPGVWHSSSHPRVQEWQARLVYPINYQPVLHTWDGGGPPITVRITYHLNWGREGAESRTTTRLLSGGDLALEGISFDLGK